VASNHPREDLAKYIRIYESKKFNHSFYISGYLLEVNIMIYYYFSFSLLAIESLENNFLFSF